MEDVERLAGNENPDGDVRARGCSARMGRRPIRVSQRREFDYVVDAGLAPYGLLV
ncbi:hypothetical protein [Streptomyces halobius]|uniref:Uncharacterized protein n=1 Tax=Streptomyces halobius TaxID=2879846 RepID=A0ABY4MM52_9ACTN|nr:hypothetical protein [Streptomyces halobius]UQA97496.1 hypothetical protein K9S39_41635 [Streptomyces halobius]